VQTLDATGQSNGDQLSMTSDGQGVFLAYGNQSSVEPIRLFHGAAGVWSSRLPLEATGRPGYSRSLVTGPGGFLWLSYRDGDAQKVARYDPAEDQWAAMATVDASIALMVDGLTATSSGEVCVAGRRDSHLEIDCSVDQPPGAWAPEPVGTHQIFYWTPMVTVPEGAVVAVYDAWSGDQVRVVWRGLESAVWHVETLHDADGYGLSAAVGPTGALHVSFIACDDTSCRLVVLVRDEPFAP
jgi:hypothetical protein